MDEAVILCEECQREVDEFVAVAEQWVFWSDGSELLPRFPECSERAFAGDAKEPVALVAYASRQA